MDNENIWCFAWHPEIVSEGKTRAALAQSSQWNPSDKIKVRFLDGEPSLHEKVKDIAANWTTKDMANLKLDFTKTEPGHIRITFQGEGSWSVYGRSCFATRPPAPTMSLAFVKDKLPEGATFRGTVLHEFGHALGLLHEHQNPAEPIQWNQKAVIADLTAKPFEWPLKQIEENVFSRSQADESNHTKPDKESVMWYPIPKKWTLNGFSSSLNTEISKMDRQFVRKLYPY